MQWQWYGTQRTKNCLSLCNTFKNTSSFYLGSSSLQQVNNYKYLGVTITNDLSWNLHIDNACSAAFRKLCFLKHKLRNSPSNLKLLSYFTYIKPKLEYSCVVWDPFTKCNDKNLEAVQGKLLGLLIPSLKLRTRRLNSWLLTTSKHLNYGGRGTALTFCIFLLIIS